MAVKRASSEDVARRAGVSRTTVSIILNNVPGKSISESTRNRVLAAARELNYAPNEWAHNIARIRRFTVGLFVLQSAEMSSDAYLMRLIEGITPVLNKSRTQMVLERIPRQEHDLAGLAAKYELDGLVLVNAHGAASDVGALVRAQIPHVVVGASPLRDLYVTDMDQKLAAAQAIDYLVGLGHSDIAPISRSSPDAPVASARHDGFRTALRQHRGAGRPAKVAERNPDPEPKPAAAWTAEVGNTEEAGYRAVMEILGADGLARGAIRRPSALAVAEFLPACGAFRAVREAGLRIPDDISIIGFDDDSLAPYMNPPLTTVANAASSVGAAAARMVLALMKGQQPERKATFVATSIAVRESCAAPAAE